MGLLDFFTSTPDRAKFARIAARWLEQSYAPRSFRVDDEQFRIVENTSGGIVFNLDNVYRDYCAAPRKEREHVLAKYGQALFESEGLPASFPEARGSILPVLRSRSVAEYLRLSTERSDGSPIVAASVPFSDDTLVLMAYDTENSTMTLTEQQLRDWQVSFETVQSAALENLRDVSVAKFIEFEPGLFVSDWNDAYDPSRLLFPDVLHQIPLGGERIAMIPNRNRLLVASANDSKALHAMLDLARQVLSDEGRGVSALMYRLEGGRAVEYQPDDPGVLADLAGFRQEVLADDYAGQKELLDKIHEKNGVDTFVATYKMFKPEGADRFISMAVWTEGVDCLLPRTDVVALVSEQDIEQGRAVQRFIGWDELQRAAGPFALVDHCYPPRYRPSSFPTPEQREAFADALA